MREILFKAKRLDNGEWAYGYLMQHEESGRCIIGGIFAIGKYGYIDTDCHEVDPETVCQFTGVIDKIGYKVFENDIVKLRTGRICKVVFKSNSGLCAFDLDPIGGFEYPAPKSSVYMGMEVIGNIHDKEEPNNEN